MEQAPRMADPSGRYWDLVRQHRFSFCRCARCGHAWLPASRECPRCLQADAGFEPASGAATLLSWVTYHRAYHDSVADRVPYVVALVRLAEGPRLIANLDGAGEPSLQADQPLELVYMGEGESLRPGFRPVVAGGAA